MPETKHYKKSFIVEPENTSLLVAEAFGIGPGWVNNIIDVRIPNPLPNITLITGESGCGKSTLLKEIGIPTTFELSDKPLHAWAETDEESLRLLNSVGLNDASLFVLRYNQLSDSQQARARMYYWLCQKQKILIVDEFLSTLDRKTAQALAFSFQKMLRRENIKLIAATAHDDIIEFLQPDLIVRGTAFPSNWTVEPRQIPIINPFENVILIKKEMAVSKKETPGGICQICQKMNKDCKKSNCPGNINVSVGKDEYRKSRLGEIHYKGKYVGGPQEYISARLEDKIIGWLVGQKQRTGTFRIARVVVHPTYRGCGIGQKLVKFYLTLHPNADTVAAMARFNPVFEKAGMKRLNDIEITPPKELKHFSLTIQQWASKEECKKFLKNNPKCHAEIIKHISTLGRDLHPGGEILDLERKKQYVENIDIAAQVLWRHRPRKMAKFRGQGE